MITLRLVKFFHQNWMKMKKIQNKIKIMIELKLIKIK